MVYTCLSPNFLAKTIPFKIYLKVMAKIGFEVVEIFGGKFVELFVFVYFLRLLCLAAACACVRSPLRLRAQFKKMRCMFMRCWYFSKGFLRNNFFPAEIFGPVTSKSNWDREREKNYILEWKFPPGQKMCSQFPQNQINQMESSNHFGRMYTSKSAIYIYIYI